MSKFDIYNLNDLEGITEHGMEFRVCQRLGHFDNKVAVEYIILKDNSAVKTHHHEESSTLILVLTGAGYLTDGDMKRYPLRAGTIAYIPAKMRHGVLTEDTPLYFIAIENPPIENLLTGEVDVVE